MQWSHVSASHPFSCGQVIIICVLPRLSVMGTVKGLHAELLKIQLFFRMVSSSTEARGQRHRDALTKLPWHLLFKGTKDEQKDREQREIIFLSIFGFFYSSHTPPHPYNIEKHGGPSGTTSQQHPFRVNVNQLQFLVGMDGKGKPFQESGSVRSSSDSQHP